MRYAITTRKKIITIKAIIFEIPQRIFRGSQIGKVRIFSNVFIAEYIRRHYPNIIPQIDELAVQHIPLRTKQYTNIISFFKSQQK